MDITGIVKVIGETAQVSEKFKKRDFVLTDNSSQYPQHISFQVSQDKCSLLDACKVGDEIKVHFNLRGKEWIDPKGAAKYFNTLDAWRIEGGTKAASGQHSTETKNEDSVGNKESEDDLPF